MPNPKRKTAKSDYEPLQWGDAPDLLTVTEVARLLGAHHNTIDKWLRAGKIDYQIVGRVRKIKKADLAGHAGITLNADGGILTDDGRLLASYAKRFDKAIERLRKAQAGHARAIEEIQDIVDEMRKEGE